MSALLPILGLFFVLVLFRLTVVIARAYRRFREAQIVVCPETHTKAAVEVDAAHAAWTAALGEAEYRLVSCSRWPDRKDCLQPCFDEIESALDRRIERALPAHRSEPSACAACGEAVGEIRWFDEPLALPAAEGLFDSLPTRRPLCWGCHVAKTFGRLPVLVVEDPEPCLETAPLDCRAPREPGPPPSHTSLDVARSALM